jgi:glutamyl-tRNA(Gln) amidotransferase subunit D
MRTLQLKKSLKAVNAETGDTIEIISDGKAYAGILMPSHEFSGEDILTIKLPNGYNIGVKIAPETKIKVVRKRSSQKKRAKKVPFDKKKPTIAVIGTGGTIASYVDYRTGAVYPALTAQDLVFSVPELTDICNVKAKVLFSLFSENMRVEYWQKLAKEVANELNNGAKGVIIPHGTDVLGYTSSVLSFMLQDLNGAVILVGSQRSSDRTSSDAYINLIASAKIMAESDLGEVVVVMHGETSDSYCTIHRGTRVRKMHSSRRDAFKSINEQPIGKIMADRIIFSQDYGRKSRGKVKVKDKMESDVAMIYYYPGMKIEHFNSIAEQSKGIVIAGTGLGHVSTDMIKAIGKAIKRGVHIVMTTQCLYGRVNMNIYSAGRDLIKAGIVSGEDMLPETAYIKLMWVLGQTQEQEEVKRLMRTNLVGEISEGRSLDERA